MKRYYIDLCGYENAQNIKSIKVTNKNVTLYDEPLSIDSELDIFAECFVDEKDIEGATLTDCGITFIQNCTLHDIRILSEEEILEVAGCEKVYDELGRLIYFKDDSMEQTIIFFDNGVEFTYTKLHDSSETKEWSRNGKKESSYKTYWDLGDCPRMESVYSFFDEHGNFKRDSDGRSLEISYSENNS